MNGKGVSAWRWLTAVIFLHLIVSTIHGTAHAKANVPLSPAAGLFVLLVIFIGPLAGLALAWPAERIGSWFIAITMAGAFEFGLVNHFVLDSPDHVVNVAPQWQLLFATTAILLALIELLGCALAIRVLRERKKVA
jgi:hypothetical protein